MFQGTTVCWSYSLSHHKRKANRNCFLFQVELQTVQGYISFGTPRQDTPKGKELIEAWNPCEKTPILLGIVC